MDVESKGQKGLQDREKKKKKRDTVPKQLWNKQAVKTTEKPYATFSKMFQQQVHWVTQSHWVMPAKASVFARPKHLRLYGSLRGCALSLAMEGPPNWAPAQQGHIFYVKRIYEVIWQQHGALIDYQYTKQPYVANMA